MLNYLRYVLDILLGKNSYSADQYVALNKQVQLVNTLVYWSGFSDKDGNYVFTPIADYYLNIECRFYDEPEEKYAIRETYKWFKNYIKNLKRYEAGKFRNKKEEYDYKFNRSRRPGLLIEHFNEIKKLVKML